MTHDLFKLFKVLIPIHGDVRYCKIQDFLSDTE